MNYDEADFLQISGIQHFMFCQRQWALAYIEQNWVDNVLTYEGHELHEKADQPEIREKRGAKIIARALRIHSRESGLTGICDVVEFHQVSQNGVQLVGEKGFFQAIPVEYKHGKKKYDLSDTMQLLAEAICLEEMLGTEIDHGEVYYQKVRHREMIEFTPSLREKFFEVIREMHQYWERRFTPKVKPGNWCRSCSLKDVCLPELLKKQTVASYLKRRLAE